MIKKTKHGISFDSLFELRVYELDIPGFIYHPIKINYNITWEHKGCTVTTNHTYAPDFVQFRKNGPDRLFELKGAFHDRAAVTKMQKLIEILEPTYEVWFVFEKGNAPLTRAQPKRKDGSRFSVSEWCDKHGYRYVTEAQLRKKFNKKEKE